MKTKPFYFQLHHSRALPDAKDAGVKHDWTFYNEFALITQFSVSPDEQSKYNRAIIYNLEIGGEQCLQMGASYTGSDFSRIRPKLMLITPGYLVRVVANRELSIFGYALLAREPDALLKWVKL